MQARFVFGIPAAASFSLLLFVGLRPVYPQGLPFNTPTALPLALAENSLRPTYRHTELTLDRGDEPAGSPRLGIEVLQLVIPYGVTSKTTLVAGISYGWRSLEADGAKETSSGFADLFVSIKQQLLVWNFRGGTTRLAAFGGASLPTGKTEAGSSPLPLPLRLGSGAVNLSGRAVMTHANRRLGVTGMAGYAVATDSYDGVRSGDRFDYALALGYRLAPAIYGDMTDRTWVAYVELNGTAEARSTRQSVPLRDSGGHLLFFAPGLQFIPTPRLLFEAAFQLPLVRDANGEQLTADWSFAVGGRFNMYFLGR